jgi:hypothetical protein
MQGYHATSKEVLNKKILLNALKRKLLWLNSGGLFPGRGMDSMRSG